MRVAWVRGIELEVWEADGAVRPLASAFAARAQERHASTRRRRAWKGPGPGAQIAGRDPEEEPPPPARVLDVAPGHGPDELLYLLHVAGVTGLFRRDLGEDGPEAELRVRHGVDHPLHAATVAEDGREYVVAAGDAAGTHLARVGPGGERLLWLTEGESFDGGPRRVPGAAAVVYHSAGLGRDASGQVAGRGPFELLRLDLVTGAVAEVAAEGAWDLTEPRPLPDGSVLALRRPYAPAVRPSPLAVLGDLLALPFRVVFTLLGWLQVAALRYTGRTLTSGGGVPQGLLLPVVADDARGGTLVRVAPGGQVTVVREGVRAFDVAADGAVVLSDGERVWRRGLDGGEAVLAEVAGVDRLAVVG